MKKDELVGEMRLPDGMFIKELALTKLPGALEARVAMQASDVAEGTLWVIAAFTAYAEAHNMNFKHALSPAILEMMERINDEMLWLMDIPPRD